MSVVNFVGKKAPGLMRAILSVPLMHKLAVRGVINSYAKTTMQRPRPYSLIADYTSWQSLTDKSYTSRHLPPADRPQVLPDLGVIAELWKRDGDKEIPSEDTSMLLSFYAQWFTDSFLRTHPTDRSKNISNHQIDFCQVYGMKPHNTAILRSHQGGKLRSQLIDGQEFPPYLYDAKKTTVHSRVFAEPAFEKMHNPKVLDAVFPNDEDRLKTLFLTGLEHGNSQVGYTLMAVIALREHNRICDELAREYPEWDDDRLFETARMILTVMFLKITLQDYVGHIATHNINLKAEPGWAEKQDWYRENWISIEFDLLYRWHSMIPEKLSIAGEDYNQHQYRNNPALVVEKGVEAVVTGASRQLAGKMGMGNTPGFFFAKMGDMSIQERTLKMARDANLRPYNEYRVAFGLKPVASFEELTGEKELAATLEAQYGHIDDLEWYVGLFAEKHRPLMMMGELQLRMVAYDAFTHALTNPLLSKHVYGPQTFSPKGMEMIDATNTLQDVVSRNTDPAKQAVAKFTAVESVPGSYGVPVLGRIYDTIDFLFLSGWHKFLSKHIGRNKATVFKTNLFEPVVIVADSQAMEVFTNWDGRLTKEPQFGPAAPPPSLTGGFKANVFDDGEKHARYKEIFQSIVKSQSRNFDVALDKLFDAHAEKWVALGSVDITREMEELAIRFSFEWLFELNVSAKDVSELYLNLFNHKNRWITGLIPNSMYRRSKRNYDRLVALVRTSPAFLRHAQLAEASGPIDREELCHQLIFMTGMNVFLGLQNMSKSIFGELSRHPHTAKKMRAGLGHNGTDISNFVKEVLRLHPPVFFIFGKASKDFTLDAKSGSYQIRRDDRLVGAIPAAQILTTYFEDAEDFNPDRFNEAGADSCLHWAHGRHAGDAMPTDHQCPGRDFATMFARKLIVKLLEGFQWELAETPEWSQTSYGLNVAAPKGPLATTSFTRRVDTKSNALSETQSPAPSHPSADDRARIVH